MTGVAPVFWITKVYRSVPFWETVAGQRLLVIVSAGAESAEIVALAVMGAGSRASVNVAVFTIAAAVPSVVNPSGAYWLTRVA